MNVIFAFFITIIISFNIDQKSRLHSLKFIVVIIQNVFVT